MILLISIINIVLLVIYLYIKRFSSNLTDLPFECGFNPFMSSRVRFSLKFYLICLIFLIFDVEIALVLPLIFSRNSLITLDILYTTGIIRLVLLVGLLVEIVAGSIE